MAEIDSVTQYVAWTGIASALVGALVGALIAHVLHRRHESDKTSDIRKLHLAALEAEVIYNARLAATYATENIVAPLYRFPRTVYDTVYANLVSEILSAEDITALTGFYSLVDQMNRGLDTIALHIAQDRRDQEEYKRLLAKAAQMRHADTTVRADYPQSEFYDHALSAIRRHLRNA